MADRHMPTILVVDDTEAGRYTVVRTLQRAGFKVWEAANGAEALRKVADKPDLVILDVNLPDLSGFEVCRRIKADPATTAVLVMHLSASMVESENRSTGLEGGADGYLTHPVEPRELLANIQALFRVRAAERLVREQRELLQVTLSSIGDAVIATDTHGLITFLNPVAQSLTGWSQEAAAGQPVAEVFHIVNERSRQPVDNPIVRVLREGGVVGLANHTILIARDGSERPIDDSAAPIRDADGQILGVVMVFRDISERRRAEHERRDIEGRYRALVEQIKDYAIFGMDTAGRATTWNEGVQRILGFAEAEFVGQDIVPSIFTPEDLRAGVAAQELETAAAQGTASDDRWMRRKDGTRFYALGVTNAVRDEHGKLTGFTKVMQDQTARKRLEEDLLEADRRKTEFLATLAHELRNPLAPIRNGLQILQLSEGGLPAVQAREVMGRQLDQLVRLVDDLLDVSRITRGIITLSKESLPIWRIVEAAVESCKHLIEAAHHELTVTLPPDPLLVDGDFTRLSQVVLNLLNNAAKYTPDGGRIELVVTRQSDQVVIQVRDNGAGIAPTMLPKIWDMFAQVDRTLDRSQGGLGIGLTLVRRLVDMHGGSVDAISPGIGHGSTFTVRLPLAKDQEHPSSTYRQVAEKVSTGKLRVLVVDDNRDSAESLALLMQLSGQEVATAHDGPGALELAATFLPNVVLLDIGLPGMDGYEVAKRLRQLAGVQQALLIAQTGYGQEEDRRRSREAGFDAHLIKPVDFNDLRPLLANFRT